MRSIPLTRGLVAIVDDDDYERLAAVKWYAHQNGRTSYALRHIRDLARADRQAWRAMHREVLRAESGSAIDHINGNGLDNRKANLRFATTQQNAFNRRPDLRNATGLRGVGFHRQSGKWQARISRDGRRVQLGLFATIEAAGRCYDAQAVEMYGSFARLNYPEDW